MTKEVQLYWKESLVGIIRDAEKGIQTIFVQANFKENVEGC